MIRHARAIRVVLAIRGLPLLALGIGRGADSVDGRLRAVDRHAGERQKLACPVVVVGMRVRDDDRLEWTAGPDYSLDELARLRDRELRVDHDDPVLRGHKP